VVEEPALVLAGPEVEEPVAVLGVDPGVVVAGEVPPVLAEVGALAAVEPKETEVVFVAQLVLGLVMTEKGADCATAPVESRRLRSRVLCVTRLTIQVKEVALVSLKETRAAAPI